MEWLTQDLIHDSTQSFLSWHLDSPAGCERQSKKKLVWASTILPVHTALLFKNGQKNISLSHIADAKKYDLLRGESTNLWVVAQDKEFGSSVF